MSGMVFRERRRRREVNLNVTSLIDVMFLLLIFFMVTGTFKRAGELELRLPESSTATPTETTPPDEVVLGVTEAGDLFLDGEAVALPALKGKLKDLLAAAPDRPITIKAEAGVEHGRVVQLLDIVRDAGFTGVGIGTKLGGAAP